MRIDGKEVPKMDMNTGDILHDMREIIEVSRDSAYQAVNLALVRRNWLLGRRIAEEELKGESRAEYGLEIIKKLSEELTKEYGKGFDRTNLYNFLKFYKYFPEIIDTACQLSPEVYHGLIIAFCCVLKMTKPANGMSRKHTGRHGLFARCREM